MTEPPPRPLLYHIVHLDVLASIVADGCLVSDARMIARGGPAVGIGMSKIKRRRLNDIHVSCHAGTKVGDYVPFYFCPRSIMLFVIHKANDPDLTYRGGQEPIVHLEADLASVVRWALANGRQWAFSLSNAGAYYVQFRASLNDLGDVNWAAVKATDFRNPDIKEGKQAEFLVHGDFPWSLVTRIGVISQAVQAKVAATLAATQHRPAIEVRPEWYY